ncbi:hypothetical protein VTK26DRAFT_5111 [Humicola hyalothermophila]
MDLVAQRGVGAPSRPAAVPPITQPDTSAQPPPTCEACQTGKKLPQPYLPFPLCAALFYMDERLENKTLMRGQGTNRTGPHLDSRTAAATSSPTPEDFFLNSTLGVQQEGSAQTEAMPSCESLRGRHFSAWRRGFSAVALEALQAMDLDDAGYTALMHTQGWVAFDLLKLFTGFGCGATVRSARARERLLLPDALSFCFQAPRVAISY